MIGRILALDVGSVRIGVALSDPMGITAQPLLVINRRKDDPFAQVAQLVQEHEVQRVIVGYPLQLNGEKGPATQAMDTFIERLRSTIETPIEAWDERLSTKQAERSMIDDGVRRDKRRKSIDKIAAALILQSYLDVPR